MKSISRAQKYFMNTEVDLKGASFALSHTSFTVNTLVDIVSLPHQYFYFAKPL